MTQTPPEELLVGAHTSAAGGAHNALLEGRSIGATTIQLFTANQRQWKAKPLTEEGIELFKDTLQETGLQSIMSHGSYLVNLGSPDPAALKKSREAFHAEVERCCDLELTYLNIHPGAAIAAPREECLDRIVESILQIENLLVDDSLHILLESTAGQGSSVGSSFEELAYILERVKKRVPVGVCIDTCHIFATGYDIRTPQGWQKTLEHFDNVVGLKHLHAFHLNDSVHDLGSRRDRHASLGEGKIGMESFRFLMKHPATREIPKYLETPEGCPVWEKEIWMLREFAKGK